MAKKEEKYVLYDDLFDYLSYESVRENKLLRQLYSNLDIENETSFLELDEKEKRVKGLIGKLLNGDIKELLTDKTLDKKVLIKNIEDVFNKQRAIISRSDEAFVNGYFPVPEELDYDYKKSNKKGKEPANKPKGKQCNFDEFVQAVEAVSDVSFELGYLDSLLDTNRLFESVKPNKMNSHIKQFRKSIEEAFSKLKKADMQKLLGSLEKVVGKNATFNQSYILNEYSRRLREILNSLQSTDNKKFKEARKSKIAGYTVDVKKRNENLTLNNKFVSSTPKMEEYDRNKQYSASQLISYFKADGQSIIDFIDKHFNTNILNNFFEEFKDIKTDDLPRYVERTNKLIEDTVFYSYFPDIKKIIESVKSNYHLEFSPLKEDKAIIEELISDELRYYQQKNIEDKLKSMDTTFLDTSKRISKESLNSNDDEGPRIVFEELHTSYLPHYAFTQNAFNLPFIVRSHKNELPEDYIAKHITGSSFLAYPANVEINKNDKNEYVVTTNTVSRFRL